MTTRMGNFRNRVLATAAILALLACPQPTAAAVLRQETLEAWNFYVRQTEARIETELRSPSGFLAQDFQTAAGSRKYLESLRSGEVLVAKMTTLDPAGRKISVRGGTINHWRGVVFIPDTALETILAGVRKPPSREEQQKDVLESRILSETDDSLRLYLKLVRSKIITVTYNTEHFVTYRRHGDAKASSRSIATKIAELEKANTPAEKEKPEGNDSGFLWRLNSYWRYQQVKGGVLVECESLTLSRSVPRLLRPIATPMIKSIARGSMRRTLDKMRDRFHLSTPTRDASITELRY